MLRWLPTALVVGSACLPGCYLSHPGERGAPFDAGSDPVDGRTPGDGRVPPFDGRVPPRFDADTPPFDADFPRFDADTPPFDADFPRFDADTPPPDADFPRFDADTPPFDADFPRFDADTPPFDSGVDSGPPRPALRFGRTTFFEVADSPPFDTPRDHTIEMWVRSRERRADADFCQKGDMIARHFFLGLRDGRLAGGWQPGPGAERFVLGPPLTPGRWTHVALVVREQPDGRHSASLVVDGSQVATEFDLADLFIAFNDVEFTCGHSDFDVDEIRLWRFARSATDLSSNMRRRISGATGGLVAYWRLDESGQIGRDYTGMALVAVLGNRTRPDSADPQWILDGAL